MRAFGFLATFAVLVIVIILTLKNLNRSPSRALEETTGIESVPANLTEVPTFARDKLNEAMKQSEERTKKGMEGLE